MSAEALAASLRLGDYRHRVAEAYAVAREPGLEPELRWRRFRSLRDALFASHPASPLAATDRERFTGLPFYPYDPTSRVLARAEDAIGDPFSIELGEDGTLRLAPIANLFIELQGAALRLALYQLLDYGGGLFLPFRDATSGSATYGGGRYLLDTRKHADLGVEDGRLVLDFNFAYHPSCVYDPRWVCPLAPRDNWLGPEIRAGERLPPGGWYSDAV